MADLDPVIHQPVRLRIMASLAALHETESAEFTFLRELLGLTATPERSDGESVVKWFDGRIASVIPVPEADSDNQPITAAQASYANFVWGVPAEPRTEYPALGLSTRAAEGGGGLRQVIRVEKDSLAQKAGFAVGDVILSADGQAVKDNAALNAVVAAHTWGDAATFVVRRGGQETALAVHFRRSPAKE